MATRDDVLRRLAGMDSPNQIPVSEPPQAGGTYRGEGADPVVVPFAPGSQQDGAAHNGTAGSPMMGDSPLGDAAHDLVKPLVKTWLANNIPQSLDRSIREAVKPLLTNWMDTNLPQRIDSVIQELFKPLLTAWLDRNLASTIQRGAHREIARLTGKVPDG